MLLKSFKLSIITLGLAASGYAMSQPTKFTDFYTQTPFDIDTRPKVEVPPPKHNSTVVGKKTSFQFGDCKMFAFAELIEPTRLDEDLAENAPDDNLRYRTLYGWYINEYCMSAPITVRFRVLQDRTPEGRESRELVYQRIDRVGPNNLYLTEFIDECGEEDEDDPDTFGDEPIRYYIRATFETPNGTIYTETEPRNVSCHYQNTDFDVERDDDHPLR